MSDRGGNGRSSDRFDNFRQILLTILIPVFAPLAVVLAGIWGAASWTTNQDNKLFAIGVRLTDVERIVKGDRNQDNKISALELRLNWLDAEKTRDREESKQINREIRDALDKLNNAVIRLEANDPIKRRR